MSIVDLTLVILLSLFAVRGYFRGLFLEVLSILGIFAGFLAAVQYNDTVAGMGREFWNFSPIILKSIAFLLVFLGVYFVFNLVGWLFQRWSNLLFLTGFNRVGGVVVGAGKGAAFLALILFFLGSATFIPKKMKDTVDDSYLVPPLNRFGQGLVQIGKDRFFLPSSQDEEMKQSGDSGSVA